MSSTSNVPKPLGANTLPPTSVPLAGGANAGAANAVTDGLGKVFAGTRRVKDPVYADAEGISTIWFPFNENSGSKVYDQVSNLVGSFGGGSSTTRWNQHGPGVSPNGTNNRILVTDGTPAGFISSTKQLFDLTTLVSRGDMICAWYVVSHPTSGYATDAAVFGWGCSNEAKGGWALGIKASNQKPIFMLRTRGGAAVATCSPGTSSLLGSGTDNTRSAVCMTIADSKVTGRLEVQAFALPLGTDGGGVSFSTVGFDTPLAVPDGTAAPSYDATAPLTLLAWPTVDGATFSNFLGPTMALAQLGIQRRPYNPGLGMKIVRDLRRNIRAFPDSAR